jgi:predicted nucleic acid-binding protein
MTVVVSDTSPIRALDFLKLTFLLKELYGDVLVPPGVATELSDPNAALPPLDWEAIPGLRVQVPRDVARIEQLLQTLDRGESEAIALALEVRAAAILVDERAARAVAASLGLKPVGVLAMLLRAKERGLIPVVRPLMDQLRSGIDFRISSTLHAEISRLAGES